MMGKRGKFITFEGVDGSGKTTQSALLCSYLRQKGTDVVETREPGGTELGEKIREILLSPSNSMLTETSEILLFLAARAQQVAEVIMPSLGQGRWVISDRFCDSTLAYQGYGRGIDVEAIRKLNDIATGGLEPDITILLDLDAETGIRRAIAEKNEFLESSGGDRMEKETKEFHTLVREGYLELARQESRRIKMVSATGSIEEVHETVASLIESLMVKAK
jgi:dTMP kinase